MAGRCLFVGRFLPFCVFWLLTFLHEASCRLLGSLRQRADGLFHEEAASIELPLKRTGEGWYAVEVQLAGSTAHLLVDTGSSALWARIPNVSRVSGLKTSLGNFSAQYGRGAVSGDVIEAPLLLTGTVPAKPRSCRMGRAVDERGFWAKQRTIDGVMGLGCSDAGAVADALACVVPAPPQSEFSLQPPQHRVFGLQLTPTGGTLTLGPLPQAVQLNLIKMPASENCGHWTVPLLALGVQSRGDSAVAQNIVRNADALLDSGSDGIIGPTFAVIDLARRLGASSAKPGDGYGGEVTFYTVPCDADLPSVTLSLGEAQGATTTVTLRASDLISAAKDGEETCHLRVVGWETQSWILGAVFLARLQAISFDVDSGVVAIAPKAFQVDHLGA